MARKTAANISELKERFLKSWQLQLVFHETQIRENMNAIERIRRVMEEIEKPEVKTEPGRKAKREKVEPGNNSEANEAPTLRSRRKTAQSAIHQRKTRAQIGKSQLKTRNAMVRLSAAGLEAFESMLASTSLIEQDAKKKKRRVTFAAPIVSHEKPVNRLSEPLLLLPVSSKLTELQQPLPMEIKKEIDTFAF